MLSALTNRLIKNEVNEYNNNLLIESIMLASDPGYLNRYSLTNLSECNITDDELECFKNNISSVTLTDEIPVDEQKNRLLNAVKTCPVNESIDDIDKVLNQSRKSYIDACRNKDYEKKNKLISKIRELERIRSIKKEEQEL